MQTDPENFEIMALGEEEKADSVEFHFAMDRRSFVQVLGTGLLIAVSYAPAMAQEGGRRRGGDGNRGGGQPVAARIHIGKDGLITVLTGKVEMGQGARTELTQAAAEELCVPVMQVRMVMGDTGQVPDDGLTAGSRTTPSTMPAVRRAAAAARELLTQLAERKWDLSADTLEVRDGKVVHSGSEKTLTYADLASEADFAQSLQQTIPNDIALTSVEKWRVLGKSQPRTNRVDLVTGAHKYPSDFERPGMLYGRVLRPPGPGYKLASVDLAAAKAMKDVVAVQDGSFVGVAAPSTWLAQQAVEALGQTAKWDMAPHPSSKEIYKHLRDHVEGGVPKNEFNDEMDEAAKKLQATYTVAYVQHAPMETRTALAEWTDGKLTVWTGTQNPFGYHRELTRAFRLPNENVRVIVPDFGGGFGGKHTGEGAIEAARLAQAASKPVLLRWTREEEFTWAYFRPAGVIEAEATLDKGGRLTSWHFTNVNSGGSAVDTPYKAGKTRCRTVGSQPPLRQGSYRALAAMANTFARECFMDELAALNGADPLDFRLSHLEPSRLRDVLEEAARRFKWRDRVQKKQPGVGVGLGCGTEKGSYVAACAEVLVESPENKITVRGITQVFECGAIVNPENLMAQVQSCIIMGLGPALWEEMLFADGQIRNAAFGRYRVPRFRDVPKLDVHLLNRPDLPSAGGSETPIIAVAPAIANAVFQATGKRSRQMPIRLSEAEEA